MTGNFRDQGLIYDKGKCRNFVEIYYLPLDSYNGRES
jgi:hypothetical protein